MIPSCLTFKSSTSSTPVGNPPHIHAQTPISGQSSSQPSPTVNLTREYTFAVQSNSYNEIWSKIHIQEIHCKNTVAQVVEQEQQAQEEGLLLLAQVLQPNRESVQEVLKHANPTTLTRLISSYFEQSEHATHLCLDLHHTVQTARSLYSHLHDIIQNLPFDEQSDSCLLNQSQCNSAFDAFFKFNDHENPFPDSSENYFRDMRQCFFDLKQQLDSRIHKSRSKIRYFRRAITGSALCFVGVAIGVTLSAFAIAFHAMVALGAASPLFMSAFVPSKLTKKELARIAQLDAAAKGTYVLNNDLDTIDRLVARLHTVIEADKLLVRLGLERGRNRYPIQEVVKQLRKNNVSLFHQLMDLEEHICLCFATVNRARSLLLQEIHLCK